MRTLCCRYTPLPYNLTDNMTVRSVSMCHNSQPIALPPNRTRSVATSLAAAAGANSQEVDHADPTERWVVIRACECGTRRFNPFLACRSPIKIKLTTKTGQRLVASFRPYSCTRPVYPQSLLFSGSVLPDKTGGAQHAVASR